MRKFIIGFCFSLPLQLFFLHFRRYQISLLFWYILFATISGHFLNNFGAVSLYLAPEYIGSVSFISTGIVGISIGIFIMSWNITTFILFSKYITFLATTEQPFLKYCINNAIMPLLFLVVYCAKGIMFERQEELNNWLDIITLIIGFLAGFILAVSIAFVYFFAADKTIYYSLSKSITVANNEYTKRISKKSLPLIKSEFRVDWFLTAFLNLRKPRDVRHYSTEFLDSIFKRHHLMAVLAILTAFIFLLVTGFFSDNPIFQLPAAASITILFAILIAVAGAFTVFLKSWSLPLLVVVYTLFNYLYIHEYFDPRNKVYGLDYNQKNNRPNYDVETIKNLASDSNIQQDKQQYLKVLNNWKKRQNQAKPIVYIINVSGGGTRSATFTMNVLQTIDSLLQGKLLQQTILINGASGGMLGASYFRELYFEKLKGKKINLQDDAYVNDIAKDILNPLFSSFVARDIIGPVQKFIIDSNTYVKDRGYAFEQKLNENTHGLLNKQLKDYVQAEQQALLPTIIYNSVISRDGRKMIIGTQPLRFLMRPLSDSNQFSLYDPDAIDFTSFFAKQHPLNIKILSALRMNATFPYVLPNVWLPTNPIIDVMDAGLRDNYGQETTLRFIENFKDWFQQNTSKVVLIQIRDRAESDWDKPLESSSIASFFTRPFLLLQNNWFKIQDYYQHDQLEYLYKTYGSNFTKVCFQYIPNKKTKPAGLSFHLTNAEKKDIAASVKDSTNQAALQKLKTISQSN